MLDSFIFKTLRSIGHQNAEFVLQKEEDQDPYPFGQPFAKQS